MRHTRSMAQLTSTVKGMPGFYPERKEEMRKRIGAGDEIRTRDPLVGNEMLYH